MLTRKKLGYISIPDYPRRIRLSNAQRAKYWEWDSTTIKCKSKKLLQKYINQDYREAIILNDGNVRPEYLKKDYHIVAFKGNQDYFIYGNAYLDSVNFRTKFTRDNLKKPIKEFLCKVTVNKQEQTANVEKVLANPKQAGTPKLHIISGQDFHVGLDPFIRTKVVDTLHAFYYNHFSNYPLDILDKFKKSLNNSYPLYIEMEIKDTVKSMFDNTKEGNGKHWDVGNRALPYMKTFLDFLDKGHKDIESFIVDDDRLHVSSGNNAFFTPIEEGETRTLVFHFYSDTRSIFKKYLDLIKKKLK
jgi:hypothetical protein